MGLKGFVTLQFKGFALFSSSIVGHVRTDLDFFVSMLIHADKVFIAKQF